MVFPWLRQRRVCSIVPGERMELEGFDTVWGFLEKTEPWVLEDLEDREQAMSEDQDRALLLAASKGVLAMPVPAPEWLPSSKAYAFPVQFLLEFYPAVP